MTVPSRPTDPGLWERLRSLCGALPDTSERTSHGELAWFVGTGRKARQFAMTWDHHHGDRNGIVFAAPPGAQDHLVGGDGERYFVPPYLGGRGWVGMYLDTPGADWDRLELHLADAHEWVGQQ